MAERLVGAHAPDFDMKTALGDGENFGKVNLKDYKGKWLVMFFYPLDFTFVWPTEITGFSDRFDNFKELNAEVLGISTDSIFSHKAWMNTPRDQYGLEKLRFPLASDITHQYSKDYGVYVEEEGIATRGLFIIDPDGIVKYQVVHDLNVGRSASEVLRVLQALQTGGLCPLDWDEDSDLIEV